MSAEYLAAWESWIDAAQTLRGSLTEIASLQGKLDDIATCVKAAVEHHENKNTDANPVDLYSGCGVGIAAAQLEQRLNTAVGQIKTAKAVMRKESDANAS